MENTVIKIENLTKVFKRQKKLPGFMNSVKGLFKSEKIIKKAVDDISFEVKEGEIVGFLGPNGAGKTTTLKMLAGILYPTSGSAEVAGYTPWDRQDDFKKKIGLVMGQKQQLIWDLPAADSYELFKVIYELPEKQFRDHMNRLVDLLDVRDILNIQVRQLSLGQRMKMEIIAALLHKPKILFLDEPTLGLDFISQQNIRNFFREYNKEEKTTVLLTSHYMEDVKALCERVVIINNGKVVYNDLLDKLVKEGFNTKLIRITLSQKCDKDLKQFGKVVKKDDLFAEILVPYKDSANVAKDILNELPVDDITIEDPEAEDVIKELFQKETENIQTINS